MTALKYRLRVTIADDDDPAGIELLTPVISLLEADDMGKRLRRMLKGAPYKLEVMNQRGKHLIPAPAAQARPPRARL